MLLYEPPPSPGDLRFRLFGVPVRVHPLFWLITAMMGLNSGGPTPPGELIQWVGIVFVSILIHEMGHAVLQMYYGGRPWVTLHGMGGLANCDDCDRRPLSQIPISLAGPAAGFLAAALVALGIRIAGNRIGIQWGFGASETLLGFPHYEIHFGIGALYWEPLAADAANHVVANVFYVNILWGLVNLLPVYPLDGGRIAREICTLGHPQHGIVLSLRISIATALAMAAIAAMWWHTYYTAALFAYLAYANFAALGAYQRGRW